MLRSVDEIIGYRLNATDGVFGKCKDLLFDDRWWTIRHMVSSTGPWLMGRLVLVSPMMIQTPDWGSRSIYLNVSKETIENCPAPMDDETVSREHERKIALYYGYPDYWADEGLWGPVPNPAVVQLFEAAENVQEDKESPETNHLRSFNEVKGYRIETRDGPCGSVQDFILEDDSWTLRHLIVDTGNLVNRGKKIILPMECADRVSWSDRTVGVSLGKNDIHNGPEFNPDIPVNAEFEKRLYDFYGRPYQREAGNADQEKTGRSLY